MLRTLSVLLIISAMLVLPGRHAGAAQSAVNEWDETTPTGWYWYYNQTADNVTATINSLNQRIVDLEVQQVNPLRFAAAYVQNTGAYESGWWWYYGLDEDGVNDYLSQNNARLLDIESLRNQRRPALCRGNGPQHRRGCQGLVVVLRHVAARHP